MSFFTDLCSERISTVPTLLVIPTGIGCSIGGFAGDAIPSARLLAAASGCLITHPNVMNGGTLYWNDHRIQYVEGYGIDRFAAGEIMLRPVRRQRVGIIFDSGLESDLRLRHLQVADACRATLGLEIGPVVDTEIPLDIKFQKGGSGSSWGSLAHPDDLLRAGEKLKEAGATAIAIVTRFPDDFANKELELYRKGAGVDSISGVEAVISHLLVRHLSIPCAHAPAFGQLPIILELDPRASAEEIGYTFLPSVLVGLSRAPDMLPTTNDLEPPKFNVISPDILTIDQLGAAVVPEGALGGDVVLSCLEREVPIITVPNPSILSVNSEALGLNQNTHFRKAIKILKAKSYAEAAGFLLLIREGISIDSVQRPLRALKELN